MQGPNLDDVAERKENSSPLNKNMFEAAYEKAKKRHRAGAPTTQPTYETFETCLYELYPDREDDITCRYEQIRRWYDSRVYGL